MPPMTSFFRATALALPVALGAMTAQAADIVDTLKQNKQFNQLAQAIEKAGIQSSLKGEGPFTVFAPTNEAFKKLPQGAVKQMNKQQLKSLLQHHVVKGEQIASDQIPERLDSMAGGRIDTSLAGNEIVLYSAPKVGQQGQGQEAKGAMKADIERAKVAEGDIQADNGVIHAISAVLVPPDMEQALQQKQGQQS